MVEEDEKDRAEGRGVCRAEGEFMFLFLLTILGSLIKFIHCHGALGKQKA